MVILRDGSVTADPRLGALKQFDERSRNYPVMATIDRTKPRSFHWSIHGRVIDQGREGACVGFAWTNELTARPTVIKGVDNEAFAMGVYRAAQKIDPWPGENYSGTSTLAGVQILQQMGYVGEYRWAFSLNETLTGVSRTGPCVLAIPWYDGMYATVPGVDGRQRVNVSGQVVGRHAILCRGVNVTHKYATLHNSWGPSWGDNGDARISWYDLERLLDDDGEACFPTDRRRP